MVVKASDVIGKRFGMLLAVKEIEPHITSAGKSKRRFECLCDCGSSCTPVISNLRSGNTKSCGCDRAVARARKYGFTGGSRDNPREYSSWSSMLERCYKPNAAGYERYGGAGVWVCDEWNPKKVGIKAFSNFLGDMGDRPNGYTLHRKGSCKVYSKDTCEWASLSFQSYDTKVSKANTSGRCGVTWDKSRGKWTASICVKRSYKYLGRYSEYLDAVKARESAEIKYFGFLKQERGVGIQK